MIVHFMRSRVLHNKFQVIEINEGRFFEVTTRNNPLKIYLLQRIFRNGISFLKQMLSFVRKSEKYISQII